MIKRTKFKGLLEIKNKSFKDPRGYFKELLREKNINKKFIFTVMSFSKKNVIRGLHLQTKNSQGKFVSVIKGKIFDVVIDLRKKSRTYGKVFTSILSEDNATSIYVPPGFAHGLCGMSKENYVIYSCTKYRNKSSEVGIMYNDKDLNIKWPVRNPILSYKDRNNLSFKDYKKKYK